MILYINRPTGMFDLVLHMKATFYPGLVDPINKGGLGFDYCVNLAPSEMWPFLIANVPVQDWSVSEASASFFFLILEAECLKNFCDLNMITLVSYIVSASGWQTVVVIFSILFYA